MCKVGAIKSKVPVHPSKALYLMLSRQGGGDGNSGLSVVMQDLYDVLGNYEEKPLLSLACTQKGAQLVEDNMDSHNFVQLAGWIPVSKQRRGLDIKARPYYIFRNYEYPGQWATAGETRGAAARHVFGFAADPGGKRLGLRVFNLAGRPDAQKDRRSA